MQLNLDVVLFSEPPQSTPNAVLIYNHANREILLDVVQGIVSTTHSPRMVKFNYVISCLCHVTHIYMDVIWTISFMHYTQASFGQLYQSTYNFQLNHTNHVSILIHTYILSTCQYIMTHILTSNQLLPIEVVLSGLSSPLRRGVARLGEPFHLGT